MKRLLRLAFATLVVFAFATGPGLPTPHMLGMDCSADCPECVTECCCGPAVGLEAPAAPGAPRAATSGTGVRMPATSNPVADPRLPGAPTRGPPS